VLSLHGTQRKERFGEIAAHEVRCQALLARGRKVSSGTAAATAPDAGVAGAPLQMAPVTVESFARRTTGDDRVKSCPAVAVIVGTTCWV
jgi:hypothetical protein